MHAARTARGLPGVRHHQHVIAANIFRRGVNAAPAPRPRIIIDKNVYAIAKSCTLSFPNLCPEIPLKWFSVTKNATICQTNSLSMAKKTRS